MTGSGKDIVSERYQQENPEGARLVTEEVRSAERRADPPKKRRRSAEENAETAKTPKTTKTPKTSETAKKAAKGTAKKTSEKGESAPGKPDKPSRSGKSKRSEPAKRTGKTAAKKPEEAPEEQQSVKTPSVMKLVQDSPLSENQVIAAGKSRIPRQLRGIEPLSRVMRREAAQMSEAERVRESPEVSRDLTEMVIRQNAPEILRRFNACDCEQCRNELSRLAAAEIPARYIKLPELADLSYDGFSREEKLLIGSLTKTAVSVMIKMMIANKKRNFHN